MESGKEIVHKSVHCVLDTVDKLRNTNMAAVRNDEVVSEGP